MLNKLILFAAILAALITGNAIGASLMTHERIVYVSKPVFVPSKPTRHAITIEPGAFTVLASAVQPARRK